VAVTAAGNVGIGTTSPGNNGLSVNKTSGTGAGIQMYQSGTEAFKVVTDNSAAYVQAIANIPMQFYTNNTERMRITSAGNVGIGTSSPTSLLTLGSGTFSTAAAGTSGLYTTSGGGLVVLTDSFNLATRQGGSRMLLDSSGNLLVGTTTNTDDGKLQVLFAGNAGSGTRGIVVTDARTGSASDTLLRFVRNTANVGNITCTDTTTTYATSSDYRLKENIALITDALAKVAALKPCTYNWKANGSEGQGFIAHELQEVVPECVTGEKDEVDADGNPVYQGIDTSFLVATLTAAIQELKAELDTVKAELETLKGN
jgi:hypothetical protein